MELSKGVELMKVGKKKRRFEIQIRDMIYGGTKSVSIYDVDESMTLIDFLRLVLKGLKSIAQKT